MTYTEFEAEILNLTGIDLTLYKEKQMKRRLNTLIGRMGLDGYESYLELLRRDKKSPHHPAHHHSWHRATPMTEDMGTLQYFLQYITINVTEFFRTEDQWRYMADNIITELPDDAVIWSCACSTGEEPYSLAISIAMRRPLANIRIIATDIDDKVLDIARQGEYPRHTMENVYPANIDKYFTPVDADHEGEIKGSVNIHRVGHEDVFRVCDEIRSHVEFRKLNLLADPFPQNCSLIVCRNVLIYFTDEAKDTLYHQFSDSLRPGGYFFTGRTEQIIRYRLLDFEKIKGFLYRKKD